MFKLVYFTYCIKVFQLYGLAPMVANLSYANSSSETETNPVCDISDTMVNPMFGLKDTSRQIIRKNLPIWDAPLYIAVNSNQSCNLQIL